MVIESVFIQSFGREKHLFLSETVFVSKAEIRFSPSMKAARETAMKGRRVLVEGRRSLTALLRVQCGRVRCQFDCFLHRHFGVEIDRHSQQLFLKIRNCDFNIDVASELLSMPKVIDL